MSDFEPIIVMPTSGEEFARKSGGGNTPPPIVPVTQSLRSGLASQLRAVGQQAASIEGPAIAHGLPLKIDLRDEALAKSNRPYGLLSDAGLDPVAGQGRGEMVSRATSGNTSLLAQAIETLTTKAGEYAVSTFASFGVWDPISDGFPLESSSEPDSLFETAREVGRPLRIELFPWLTDLSVWTADGQSLRAYLGEVGLPVVGVAGPPTRLALYLEVTPSATAASLQGMYGIRTAIVAPSYAAPGTIAQQSFRMVAGSVSPAIPLPADVDAAVGVFDTGIAPGPLDPWISRRWVYDVGTDLDTTHGTFVAGLVVASRDLNDDNELFPRDPAYIYDAQVLPATTVSEDLIIARITEVLDELGEGGPRVWNCSFNGGSPCDPVEYGTFSQELDELSKIHGILFVQSVGNYPALRDWPPDGSEGADDGLTAPAEGVRSLAVGSLSHLGGRTPVGAAASYSRRGPGFGGQQKPDVGFWSGDVDGSGQLSGFGIRSIGPAGEGLESIGTSYATPIVSAIAANLWSDLEASGSVGVVTPALVKGAVIHSATMADMQIEDDHRKYLGAGVPRGESLALFDSPETFTTVHAVELRTGVNWEKRPFPMPACLFDSAGKLRARLTLTICYDPVVDAAFGDESVRTCVEPSFGRYTVKNGKAAFEGKMGGGHDWEKNLVDRGKWSPVKSYSKVWPQGSDGTGDWALKLRLTARDASIEPLVQMVYVFLTVEGLDEGLPVRADGRAAIADLRYPNSVAVDAGRLRVGTQP